MKAQIVKALKAMQMSLQHGEEVSSVLNESRVWAEYKDQKHDLFITNAPIAGYLTGGKSVYSILSAISLNLLAHWLSHC